MQQCSMCECWHDLETYSLVCFCVVYHALYLEDLTAAELIRKMACVCSLPLGKINQVYRQGPTGIHILLSDQVPTHTQAPFFSMSTLSCGRFYYEGKLWDALKTLHFMQEKTSQWVMADTSITRFLRCISCHCFKCFTDSVLARPWSTWMQK